MCELNEIYFTQTLRNIITVLDELQSYMPINQSVTILTHPVGTNADKRIFIFPFSLINHLNLHFVFVRIKDSYAFGIYVNSKNIYRIYSQSQNYYMPGSTLNPFHKKHSASHTEKQIWRAFEKKLAVKYHWWTKSYASLYCLLEENVCLFEEIYSSMKD